MAPGYKIALIGLWHLGENYSAGLAELGHFVTGISDEVLVVRNLENNIPPLPEPQLAELIAKNRAAGTLRYTTDFAAVKDSNVVWFGFDTPVNDDDEVDLSPIWGALQKTMPFLQNGTLVVVSSQIPVGTSKKIIELIRKERPGLKFDYVYTPENLRLGEAVKCFMEPGRIVVGAESEEAFRKIKEIFSGLNAEMVRMSAASAEMTKHALNAFLATSISFINDIADACEKSGADILDVVKALRSDPRIGQKAALGPGMGFSGGTLGRDLKAIMAFSAEQNFSAPVIEAAYSKNRDRAHLMIGKVSEALGGVKGKTVAIFGLTYKPGTRTLRRSRSLEMAAELSKGGAILHLHDPAVQEAELPQLESAVFSRDPYQAAAGCDAILFVTPWPEFKDLDFKKLLGVMNPNPILFDTANLFYDRKEEIENLKGRYFGIGR
jgi:UDPglucose 6-dehydrogenase